MLTRKNRNLLHAKLPEEQTFKMISKSLVIILERKPRLKRVNVSYRHLKFFSKVKKFKRLNVFESIREDLISNR